MHRILLFQGTPYQIYTYGAMLSLAIITAALVFVPRARRIGMSEDLAYEFIGIFILATTLGGRLMHVALEWPYYAAHPWQALNLREGGLALYGAILGGTLTLFGYAWRRKIALLDLLDAAAPSCILAQGIGRIGCFFNGCCYGKPVPPPWGMVFHDSIEPNVATIARYPTQLYELGTDLAIFFFLLWWTRQRHVRGEVFTFYIILYAITRFLIEFLREEPVVAMGLTFAQICCAVFLVGGLIGLVRLRSTGVAVQGLGTPAPEPA